MTAYAYPLACDTFGPEEIEAAVQVLRGGRYTMGARVRDFEAAFAQWTGARHAIMVNSGSSANLLAVQALVHRPSVRAPLVTGDEVLVPGLAWPTTVWPIIQLGLRPVFVDIRPDTLALDLEKAAAALTPRTRAMFVISALGNCPAMDEYVAFSEAHGLTLLEDACESLGSHSRGRHVGTFGMAGTFSFYFSHHLSTIEGGAIITDDDTLADDFRGFRAHGWSRDRSDHQQLHAAHPGFDPRFLFVSLGYNVRPTDVQAAIGLVQLGRLDAFTAARTALAADVHRMVTQHVPWLTLVGGGRTSSGAKDRRSTGHSWMALPFVVAADAPMTARAVCAALESRGVETRPIIAGNLARHPAARAMGLNDNDLPVCDQTLANGFMLGCHPAPRAGGREALLDALRALGSLPHTGG